MAWDQGVGFFQANSPVDARAWCSRAIEVARLSNSEILAKVSSAAPPLPNSALLPLLPNVVFVRLFHTPFGRAFFPLQLEAFFVDLSKRYAVEDDSAFGST